MRRGRALMVALAAGLAPMLAAGCNMHVHAGSSALGFFVPSQSPTDVEALANRLGVGVQGLSAYTQGTSWASIGSYTPPPTTLRLYLAVSMSPDNGSPAQTPANLGVYRQLAQNLVDAGQQYAILRIGWEWNTTFFSWGEQHATPVQYVTAFDDVVTTMRSVPGAHFFFDWCAGSGNAPSNGTYSDWYPGDAYVDYIGTDQYDNPDVSWNQTLTMVAGLEYTEQFAQSHRKYVSVPEWGLNGSDDPGFIDDMAGFISSPANHVAYNSYFSDDLAVNSDITQFPNAAAAFARDFA